MTPEQINKAIEEEAERMYPDDLSYYVHQVPRERMGFIEGAKYGLTITSTNNLGEQEVAPSLNNEKLYRWVKAKDVPFSTHNPCCRTPHIVGDNCWWLYFNGSMDENEQVYDIDSQIGEIDQSKVEWLEEINPQPK